MRDSCPWRPARGFSIPGIFAIIAIAAILASASTVRSATAQSPPPAAYTPDSIFMALFANGDALVEYDITTTNPVADKISVKLFGNNISELIVTDLDDKILPFKITAPGQIEITPGGATGARISYLTPDLVNKDKNTWTFTIATSVDVAIKMPADSVVIDYGSNVPSLLTVGSQTLFTFKAGNIRFSYIIGVLGTEDQANIMIKAAGAAISLAKSDHRDIVLSEEQTLLDNAVAAKNDKRFGDAVKLARQASDQVQIKIGEYSQAQKAISDASEQITQAASQGRDTSHAASLLDSANSEFSQGKYPEAKTTATQAVSAIGTAPQFPTLLSTTIIGVGVVAGGGAGAYLLIFRRKRVTSKPAEVTHDQGQEPSSISTHSFLEQQEQEGQESQTPEEPIDSEPSSLSVGSAKELAGIPESQTDTGLLGKIVAKIIEEKPHLRPEDRDVLGFLAEKEGAAFESEVRTRFSLPKTTVWRLVKRLEREELVEIRKAGGQNLIKLRFEGKQP
jgi:hypothetical protein